MANSHFAALGDVWKHLPLAELLRVDPPRHYWETHAGSATYRLTPSPARLHGAIRFLSVASRDSELSQCAYVAALRAMPGTYPGSGMLAMWTLRRRASYILCDIDPQSVQSLRAAGDSLDMRVVHGDGVATIAHELDHRDIDPAEVLVVIDPFEPHERLLPGSPTPVELAASVARKGYRLLYWYGYDQVDQRGWAHEHIKALAPEAELWCGDMLIPSPFVYPGRSGAWGCGIVLANMSPAVIQACDQLGRALERLSTDDVAADNEPAVLAFHVIADKG